MKIIQKMWFFFIVPVTIHAGLSFEQQFQKANDLFCHGQYDAAISSYEQAIAINPQCHQAYFNLGLVYAQKNNHEQAIKNYTHAFNLCNTYIKALVQTGNSYQALTLYEKAIAVYKQGLNIDPNSHDCLIGLARALHNTSLFEESISYFKDALQLRNNDANIMLELANTLNMANHTKEALDLYYKIDTIMPHNSAVLYNTAYTLKKLNAIDQALPLYEKVLALDPNHIEAHFGLGLAYLATGNFERGWPEYEWRWKRDTQGGARVLSRPLWDGSSLDNKTILLHAEQGLGDTLQFIRYAQVLKNRYAVTILFASQDPLIQLMKCCPYIDRVTSLHDQVPSYDVHAPLLSLPYIMKTRLDTVPDNVPYLYADQKLVQSWKEKMNKNTFNIGICWQGNSNYSTHFLRTAVAAKSIKLHQFIPLLTMPNITVYNLQKTTGEEQVQDIQQYDSFISFDSSFDQLNGRFMDTAAVIKNLDLMITVDTSIAHLAGGLGVTTWVLLPEPADWRWMIGRTDTPWYPTMKLFRQPRSGDWSSVLETIINNLENLLEKRNKQSLDQAINEIKRTIHMLEKNKQFDQELAQASTQLFSLIQQKKILIHMEQKSINEASQ